MKLNIVPVKLPMNPIRMAKCGMKQAMRMVNTTTPTRQAKPHTFSSPSRAQIVGNGVLGLPLKKALSKSSQAA